MTRILIFLLLVSLSVNGQINETFTDGDFDNNPQWIGSTSKFIVDSQFRLQLKAPAEASSALLFTSSAAMEDASWRFDFIMDFNPSTSNYAKVWIAADNSDPSLIKNGIAVSLGSADDAVSLQYVENGKTTTVIRGQSGRLNKNRCEGTVFVTRSGNEWRLEFESEGTRFYEGVATFNPVFASVWFGFYCNYTQTRSTLFWFDNIVVEGNPFIDRHKPHVIGHSMNRPDRIEVIFDEPVNIEHCKAFFMGETASVTHTQEDRIEVAFPAVTADIVAQPLRIIDVADLSGNMLTDTTIFVSHSLFRAVAVEVVLPSSLSVRFNKPLADIASQKDLKLSVDGEAVMVLNLWVDGDIMDIDIQKVLLPNVAYRLTVENVIDIYGSVMELFDKPVGNQVIARGDVVISEFMADPEPSMGLPSSEFIELYNNSPFAINLKDWRITVNQTTGVLPVYIFEPGSYLTLCPSANVGLFSSNNTTSPSRWPEITNSGASIVVASPQGVVTDALSFSLTEWGDRTFKDEGGWSFEIIDISNRCADKTNWGYSLDLKGGTPSQPNSIMAENKDLIAPQVKFVRPTDDMVSIFFTEPVDVDLISSNSRMVVNGVVENFDFLGFDNVFLKRIDLGFSGLNQRGVVYSIDDAAIYDLGGNKLNCNLMARFGVVESAESGDVVVNELMFNTVGDSPDFIEIFNRSDKILSLKDISIGKLENGVVKSLTPVSASDRLIFPGDYIVSGADSLKLIAAYDCREPLWVVKTARFPSLSDDGECIMLARTNGETLESFCFDKKYHSPLLLKHDGVSLERVNPYMPATAASNWHTAAASHGYSTPSAINSQYRDVSVDENRMVSLQPSYFTPDGDGIDDFMVIGYTTQSVGWSATVTIYGAKGNAVRTIANNEIVGTEGFWMWDGLDDNNRRVSPGNYIVFVKMFSISGESTSIKKSCTVGIPFRK
jgi:hypothetical protein